MRLRHLLSQSDKMAMQALFRIRKISRSLANPFFANTPFASSHSAPTFGSGADSNRSSSIPSVPSSERVALPHSVSASNVLHPGGPTTPKISVTSYDGSVGGGDRRKKRSGEGHSSNPDLSELLSRGLQQQAARPPRSSTETVVLYRRQRRPGITFQADMEDSNV